MTSMQFVALAAAVLVFVGLVLLAKLHHQPLRYGIPQCPNSKLLPLSLSATLLCAKLSGELRCRFGPDQTSRFGQPVIMVVPSDIPMDRKLVGRIGTVLRRSLP